MPERTPVAPADIRPLLARAGLRATPPRLAIWQVLHASLDEPDAVDVLRRAQSIEPRTSLGTVYRFLRELEHHGWAASRLVPHGRARWCAGTTHAPATREPETLVAIQRLAAAFGYRLVPAIKTPSPS